MGGDARYPYPKFVWSPTGGWWNVAPKNWQRNTAIAMGIVLLGAVPVFLFSASREVRLLCQIIKSNYQNNANILLFPYWSIIDIVLC